MKVGIVGASGYAGGELLRLLSNHPVFKVNYISAGSNAGEEITAIHPHLAGYSGSRFHPTDPKAFKNLDLLFLSLPHGESSKLTNEIPNSTRVVDLGADYRLTDPRKWQQYYGGSHAGKWVYGLPELPGAKEQIAKATRVANPGCYATAITLAMAPIINSVDATSIVAVAASGTTGAGRTAKISLIASEVVNSLTSYKFGGEHQHTPEIEEALSGIAKKETRISFTPILAPMPRGILATVSATTNLSAEEMRDQFVQFAQGKRFFNLLAPGQMPKTASLIGSNFISLQVAVDSHANRVVVSAAIDNLGKGAAGQAIQNANLMSGLSEEVGLTNLGIGQ